MESQGLAFYPPSHGIQMIVLDTEVESMGNIQKACPGGGRADLRSNWKRQVEDAAEYGNLQTVKRSSCVNSALSLCFQY